MIKAKCPYCQYENKFNPQEPLTPGRHYETITCDSEEGGCDRDFTVGIWVTFDVVAFKLVSVME